MKNVTLLFSLLLSLTTTSFSEDNLVQSEDLYLQCKLFGGGGDFKNAFFIIPTQVQEDASKKTIRIGFSAKDIGYSNQVENEFTVSKENWHGSLHFRMLEFDVSDLAYNWENYQSEYRWERIYLQRTDLRMSYRNMDKSQYPRQISRSSECEMVSKSKFQGSIKKIVDKGWKKGIKAEAKRLEQIEQTEKLLENRKI